MEAARARLLEIIGEQRVREEIFTIDWHFWTSHSGLSNVAFDELADAELVDEAYPMLGEPVASFVNRYLSARETVLVLQGPPGTGKTRLVRAILAALSRRKGDSATVLYTADRRALDQKIIFTTNLPNVGDIDEALLRPGRCFSVLHARALHRAEAQRLVEKIYAQDQALASEVVAAALPGEGRAATLAAVFRAIDAGCTPGA